MTAMPRAGGVTRPLGDPSTTGEKESLGANPDPELQTEQRHLAESRAQLIRMRERTAGMDSSAAGDWVSREYLESTFQLRMRQLADDPSIPLFFGRIDYAVSRGLDPRTRLDRATRLEPRTRLDRGGQLLHRPAAHLGPRRRPDGDRLASAGEPAVLPGHPDRADGHRTPAQVRVPARRPDGLRGRGPDRAGGATATPSCSRPRSSGRASGRCVTSSPRSSPSRTSSCAPT